MSDLHPTARALIAAAKRREADLSEPARARVHASVLRRAVAFGTAMATTTSASWAAKAGAVAAMIAKPVISAGLITALAGTALFIAKNVSTPSVPSPRSRPGLSANQAERVLPAVNGSTPPAQQSMVAASSVSVSASASASVRSIQPQLLPLERAASASRETTRQALSTSDRPQALEAGMDPEVARNVASDLQPETTLAVSSPSEPASPSAAPLVAQLALLHRVREALRSRQPQQALQLLDANALLLGEGPLAEEAQAARISALCQSGRAVEARIAMDRFVVAWPQSPLSPQLRSGCGTLRATEQGAN